MTLLEQAYQAMHRGDLEQSVHLYSSALESEAMSLRHRLQAYNGRGDVLYKLGQIEQAMNDYDRLIELSPNSPFSYLPRSLAYQRRGMFEKAIKDFTRMIELDEEYLYGYLYRSEANFHLGNYQHAVEDYDRLVAWSPDDIYIFFHRGLSYLYLGKFESAEADFQICLELDPEDTYAMIWLYLAREHDGRTGELQLVAQASQVKHKDWPFAVIDFFLDNGSEQTVLQAAADFDPKVEEERTCEAYFYIGQYHLLREAEFEAAENFNRCVEKSSKRFIVAAAHQELRRLGRE